MKLAEKHKRSNMKRPLPAKNLLMLIPPVIEVENYGTITVALDETAAPETVKNFVSLAQDRFYDGLTFHRIISGFMIQGGDPNGDGSGGSEQQPVIISVTISEQ
ncbi:MAG: peptidylprolyl isomerase [Ruminococcaceae bacterium]|nr:peptidylprolyl isomerase [Oscillospiraceae bacterium]